MSKTLNEAAMIVHVKGGVTENERLDRMHRMAKRQGDADCSWSLFNHMQKHPWLIRVILTRLLRTWFNDRADQGSTDNYTPQGN